MKKIGIICFFILGLLLCLLGVNRYKYLDRQSMTLYEAICRRDVEMVKIRVKEVQDLNVPVNGITYLGLCFCSPPFRRESKPTDKQKAMVRSKTFEIIKVLVEHGTNVNLQNGENSDGRTPLSSAMLLDMKELVEYLLKKGASPEIVDSRNETPLMYTIERPNYFQLLLTYGAGKTINYQNNEGNTILHQILISRDEPFTVELLIQNGADVNIRNNDGLTAIDLAKKKKRIGSLPILQQNGK